MLRFVKYSSLKLFVLLVAFFILCGGFSSLARAEHIVKYPIAKPPTVFVGKITPVVITIQIGAEPALLSQSVNLLRLDDDGKTVSILGRLKDDGIYPDATKEDGIFSIEVQFNQLSVSRINLRVSVAYRGEIKRTLSRIFTIKAVKEVDNEEFKKMVDIQESAYSHFFMNPNPNQEQAAQDTVAWLKTQEGIKDAKLTESGQIWIEYDSGLEGAVILDFSEDTMGGCCDTISMAADTLLNLPVASPYYYSYDPATFEILKSDKAIVMNAFYFPSDAEWVYHKLQDTGIIETEYKVPPVTIGLLKDIHKYGIIFLATHGAVSDKGEVCLSTSEEYISGKPESL